MNKSTLVAHLSGNGPTVRSGPRRRRAAVVASAALAASAMAAVPASATITPEGVAEGHNITVFHNIDFVAVTGWATGDPLTVTVQRGGVEIGTASGDASDPEATGAAGLEVNHGPEAAPIPGDCWEGTTPDIRPGDVVTVTNTATGDNDQVVVDDIRFTGNPFVAANGDVLVPFVARRANGAAIAPQFIDSPEFRATSRLRFEATDILVQRAAGGAPGELVMRYPSPFTPSRNRDLLNQTQLRNLLLGDGHAVGFGHTDPLPLEAMLQDGLTDTPGPAPGCESAPSTRWAVTSVTPATINLSNSSSGLLVRGRSSNATAVRAVLKDTAGAVVEKSIAITPALDQRWSLSFGPGELTPLNGNINVAGFYTVEGAELTGPTMTVLKDLVRPAAPRPSLPAGTYRRARVTLQNPAGDQIRYTLGNGSQPAPTATTGTLYRKAIDIQTTRVLKAIAIDPAGNASAVTNVRYRIVR